MIYPETEWIKAVDLAHFAHALIAQHPGSKPGVKSI